jgi:hypothetical protein
MSAEWRKGMGQKKRADDGPSWTPTESRRRDQLMRQFVKGDGPKGNSAEYRSNFDLIEWGKK